MIKSCIMRSLDESCIMIRYQNFRGNRAKEVERFERPSNKEQDVKDIILVVSF